MLHLFRRLLLWHCLSSYLAFAIHFALAVLWWPRSEWSAVARMLPIYALGAPITIPALLVAPFFPPGPGLHAVLLWTVWLLSVMLTFRWLKIGRTWRETIQHRRDESASSR